MKKEAGKKGQFYLIAAIILIALISSFASLSNYLKTKPDAKIFGLKEELQIENRQIMGYLMNNGFSQEEKNNILIDFSEKYSDYIGKDKSVYFVFGNRNNVFVSGYQNLDREIKLQETEIADSKGGVLGNVNPNSNEVNLIVDESPYNFKLTGDFNFYFIISQSIEGNEYIISG